MNAIQKIDVNDPRLTAYALGELEGTERAEIEAAVKADASLASEVDAIRAMAGSLEAELSGEETPRLSYEQRERVATHRGGFFAKFKKQRWMQGLAAVAGCGIVAVVSTQVDRSPVETSVTPPAEKQSVTTNEEKKESLSNEVTKTLNQAVQDSIGRPPREVKPMKDPAPEAEADMMAPRAPAPVAAQPPGGSAAYSGLVASGGAVNTMRVAQGGANAALGAVQIAKSAPHSKRAMRPPHRLAEPEGAVEHNTEAYAHIEDNAFLDPKQSPLSTFSADVDTGSYANMRRFLSQGSLPPKDAVRIEELLNYFTYAYAQPTGDDPVAIHVDVSEAPWAKGHQLMRVGLKAKEIAFSKRAPSNLVFLLDVSGSMEDPQKLPLVRQAMKLLVAQLGENDKVSIVVYAGNSGMVLPPTRGNQKEKIVEALDRLQAGGSTNGGEGIELAYKTAEKEFVKGGVNRVILATDGDFNVGTTSEGELIRLIQQKAKSGVFLSVFGFGMGNLKDATLEKLADKGNGAYGYIDSAKEAKKVFVEQIGGTLITVAKDVKIQVEFNPAEVAGYRLIGYENRLLAAEDFNDDTKDAGEIGSGHVVTALYELVPKGMRVDGAPPVDALKYQSQPAPAVTNGTKGELATVKLRYKKPDGDTSQLLSRPVKAEQVLKADATSKDFKWAAAVAGFGMLLRDSKHKGLASWALVEDLAQAGKGDDAAGYRAEFIDLIHQARALASGKRGSRERDGGR